MVGAAAHAGPVLGSPLDWTGTFHGWTNAAPTGDEIATMANPAGNYLRVEFPFNLAPQIDTFYTSDPGIIGDGDFASAGSDLQLTFSFFAEDVVPVSSLVYLHSTSGNPVWTYSFTPTGVGWDTYQLVFDYDSGWAGGTGSGVDFVNDLATIDWIGLNITTPGGAAADYGVDDWGFTSYIPEPGNVCMMLTALLSLAWPHRKRLDPAGLLRLLQAGNGDGAARAGS